MESTETISPPIFSARSRANSDLPTAVGPASRTRGDFALAGCVMGICVPKLFGRGGLLPMQQPKHDEAREEDANADELGRCGPAAEEMLVVGIIATEHFDKGAEDGIAHQV